MDETPRQFKEKSRECELQQLARSDTNYGVTIRIRIPYKGGAGGLLVSYETTGPYPSLSGAPGSNLCIVTCLRYHEKNCVKANVTKYCVLCFEASHLFTCSRFKQGLPSPLSGLSLYPS